MSNSQQMFKSGQAQGQGAATADKWMESARSTADSAGAKASEAAQSTQQSAQQGTEQASGFLQQTGEQVMHMAQGAVDTVKSTLGVGDSTNTKR